MSARIINGPWTFWQGLLVLAAFAVAFTTLSAGHMYWVKNTVGFEAYLGDGPRLPPKLLITSQLIKAATLFGVVWIFALKLRRLDWRSVGFKRCHAVWFIAAIVVAAAGFALRLLLAKSMVVALPDWVRFAASPYAWGDAPAPQMLVLIAMTIIVTPIAEETFFRGFLFQWMATHRPLWVAILVSSAIFGASHIVPSQAISAALMSVLITLLFIGGRSVWPCVLCHSLNNAIGLFLGMAATAGLLPPFLTPP